MTVELIISISFGFIFIPLLILLQLLYHTRLATRVEICNSFCNS
jgi:hypothetical protein